MDNWLPTPAQPGLAVLAAMLAAGGFAAWRVGGWLCGAERVTCRIAAAALVFQWLAVALFNALATAGAFNWWTGLAAWGAVAAAAWRFGWGDEFNGRGNPARESGCGVRRRWADDKARALRSPEGWIALAGFAAVALRAMRSLAAPQLNVDALQYQFLKPARWVQAGGIVRDDAPGAWGFYHYFPDAGNVLWAWFMLPSHSDAYAGIAGALAWAALLAGLYALAREVGGPRRMSAVVACAIAFSPAIATAVTSGYVDNILLVDFVFAALFVARFEARGRAGDLLLAAAALGLGAGVKTSGIPVMAAGLSALGVFAVLATRRGDRARVASTAWTASAVVAVVPLAGYLRTWIEKGSPFYPMAVTLFGRGLLPGNEEFFLLHSGVLFGDMPFSLPRFLALLFVSPVPLLDGAHVNWGPGAIVILALGVAGIGEAVRGGCVRPGGMARRNPGVRGVVVFTLAAAVLTLAGLATRTMHSQVTVFALISGRLITVALAGVGVWAALAPGRAARVMAVLALAAGVGYSLPLGLGAVDVPALGWVLVALTPCVTAAAVVAAAFGISRAERTIGSSGESCVPPAIIDSTWNEGAGTHRSQCPGGARIAVAFLVALAACTLTDALTHRTRGRFRYRYYDLASRTGDTVYDMRPLWHRIAGLYPVWRHLDGRAPLRIAATEGWGGQTSILGLRYPLLGSRFQNTVVYVPPSKSGEVIDYRLEAELRAAADYGVWRARLRKQGVDAVVSFHPDTLEVGWMRGHPEDFEPVARSLEGTSHAFRVRHGDATWTTGPVK